MSTYEYNKEWRKRNPDRLKEQQRRYIEKHKEELSKKRRLRAEKRFNENIENLAEYIEKNGF